MNACAVAAKDTFMTGQNYQRGQAQACRYWEAPNRSLDDMEGALEYP